jgi:hypothetical protein
MADARSAAQGKFALVLDGVDCGMLKSCEPGSYKVEVIEIPVAHGMFPKKTIGNITAVAFKAEMSMASAAKPLQAWIQDTLDMKHSRRSGELQRGDYDGNIKSVIEFKEALFSELTLPACDAGSKDPGFLTVGWTPETLRAKAGSGKLQQQKVEPGQKSWMPYNFKLAIDGFTDGTKRVSKVGAVTFNQESARDNVGDKREYDLIATKSKFGDLKWTFSEVDAADCLKWYEDFIIAGKTAEDVGEKTGSLEFLSPDLSKTLVTVSFANLGLLSLTSPKDEKGAGNARSLEATAYCESFKVTFG